MSTSQMNSHAAFLDNNATLAVTALRTLRLALPLSATLMLCACASSGLELAALATGDPASGDAASSNSTAPGAAGPGIVTGTLAPVQKSADNSDLAASPSIVKARGLRANGDLHGAMSVLETAMRKAPDDHALMRERGLLALELGQIKEAKQLLVKADAAGAPDWRIKSALGSAHAASGDQRAAQREFAAALKLAPDHPSILNNLALSYALDGRHAEAEKLLRTAARAKSAAPKANQNLALLLGLNGNIDEARKVSEASLPKDVATSNISYLERLKTDGVQISRAKRSLTDDGVANTNVGLVNPHN